MSAPTAAAAFGSTDRAPAPAAAAHTPPAPTPAPATPLPLAAAPSAAAERARTQTATAAALALAAGVALFAAMVVALLLTASSATHLSDADLADDPAATADAQPAAGH